MRSHFSHEIQFVKFRNVFFAISIVLVVLAIVGLLFRGVNLGIEFIGGTQVSFNDTGSISLSDMRQAFSDQGDRDATVQTSDSNGSAGFLVSTSETDPTAASALASAVAEQLGLSEDSYTVTTIGPNWGGNVTRGMVIAFFVVIALIVLFVSIRYELKMSLMAVVSLVQVLVIIAGVYAWTQYEITPNVVAALLTIMGFVLYDTVVVFNRVNENIRTYRDATHRTALQITNLAENQVVIRSINTTLTSLMPVVAMLIFGGETLKGFAFAMLIGLSFGAYSSIALAAPLYALWKTREPEWKRAEELYGEKAQARAKAAGKPLSAGPDGDTDAAAKGAEPAAGAPEGGAADEGAAHDRTAKAGAEGREGAKAKPKRRKNSGKVR
ncbi:MAG: protein translocase subunit SecF [Coriobacteriales bacterium]|jgi:preprotein translocase subunit SecF